MDSTNKLTKVPTGAQEGETATQDEHNAEVDAADVSKTSQEDQVTGRGENNEREVGEVGSEQQCSHPDDPLTVTKDSEAEATASASAVHKGSDGWTAVWDPS